MDPFALSSRIDKALSRLLRSTKTAEGKDLGVSI
jgi:hypothetical protein